MKQYYVFFSLFVFSMILAVTSNNIIMQGEEVAAGEHRGHEPKP